MSSPLWLLVLTPIAAFVGALVGHWWTRTSAKELDTWRRREDTMRSRIGGVAVSSKIVWVKPHEVAAAKVVIKAAERTGRPVSPAVRKIAAAKPARRRLAD